MHAYLDGRGSVELRSVGDFLPDILRTGDSLRKQAHRMVHIDSDLADLFPTEKSVSDALRGLTERKEPGGEEVKK